MRLFILGLCLSISLQVRGSYFIEAMDFEKGLDIEHVRHSLKKIAGKKKHLVSLGESHLHPFTARAVQEIFVNDYLSVADEFRFCSESIKDFLEHPAGLALREQAINTVVSVGNSPTRTDFRNCRTKNIDGYFTYSGFFHQLPFARPFPLEFAPNPVIIADGENIRDQMKERNSFYLIQMELEYIEMITQARLLRYPPATIEEFRLKARELIERIESAKSSFKTILESPIQEREKTGIFLGTRAFDVLPLEAVLLVTDLKYRQQLQALPLIKKISELDDQSLSALLRYLKKSPAYVTAAIQEPNENGELFETGYGTIAWRFPANSIFLEFRVATGENMLLTTSSSSSDLTCIAYKKLGPSIVNCSNYLADLP